VLALATGVVAGTVALAGLPVVHHEVPSLWDGLTSGAGLAAVLVSAAAGCTTLVLVYRSRFGPARVSAALAVAAVIAGWALAQRPQFLPGLTIDQAAASRSTLVAVLVGVGLGALVLVPSLVLLFRLFLRGRFDPHVVEAAPVATPSRQAAPFRPALGAFAASALVVGGTLTFFFESAWAHVIGVTALLVFIGTGFVALGSLAAAGDE
jgi:cytochrome d ubiquinol oxidase subunit II